MKQPSMPPPRRSNRRADVLPRFRSICVSGCARPPGRLRVPIVANSRHRHQQRRRRNAATTSALTDHDWTDGFALKFFGAMRLTPLRLAFSQGERRIGGVHFRSWRSHPRTGVHHWRLRQRGTTVLHQGAGRPRNHRRRTGERHQSRSHPYRPLQKRLVGIGERKFIEDSGITRIGEPEDVAELVAHIVSPRGRFLHGSLINRRRPDEDNLTSPHPPTDQSAR